MNPFEAGLRNDAYKKRTKILERDSYICQYCGDYGDRMDHIVPLSYWYSLEANDDHNLVAACEDCNKYASDLLFADFKEKAIYCRDMKAKYAKPKPWICTGCRRKFKHRGDGSTIFLCDKCEEKNN